MIRAALIAVLLATPAGAGDTGAAARAAADGLRQAIADLDRARGARDRIAALSGTIRVYENGLGTLRAALRDAAAREATVRAGLDAGRSETAALLGAVLAMAREPEPRVILSPDGPLATVRAELLAAHLAEDMAQKTAGLRGQLAEIAALQAVQTSALTTLGDGLASVQSARAALGTALAERRGLPHRFAESDEELAVLARGVATLDGFADLLDDAHLPPTDAPDFASLKGTLPLPVAGRVARGYRVPDGSGTARPGVSIACLPQAVVTAPVTATVRYRGPLLDYGNVMILEPAADYLIVLGGLGTVYGEPGDIIAEGAPLALMPGVDAAPRAIVAGTGQSGLAGLTETLYMELRRDKEPVDPARWFAATRTDMP